MSGAILTTDDLHKSFGRNEVLKGISLSVAEGEVIGLIGASGSGKSTLLRCINRLEAPTAGTVTYKGAVCGSSPEELNRLRRDIGMVFQRFHLFPHPTALENVTLAPRVVLGAPGDPLRPSPSETCNCAIPTSGSGRFQGMLRRS